MIPNDFFPFFLKVKTDDWRLFFILLSRSDLLERIMMFPGCCFISYDLTGPLLPEEKCAVTMR